MAPSLPLIRPRSTRTASSSRWLLAGLALLLTGPALAAPSATGELPSAAASTPFDQIDARLAPSFDLEAIQREDSAREASLKAADPAARRTAERFAVPLAADWSLDDAGTWEELEDGSRLWRLRVGSPGAQVLGLQLEASDLPTGASVWLSDGAAEVRGPFTATDFIDGRLFTPLLFGDLAIVELLLPAAASTPSLRVAGVQHGYRGFRDRRAADSLKQGACNIDVACSEADDYRDIVRSVGVYTIGNIFKCTGTLVANTSGDRRPLFLTADHCDITPSNASTVTVYWNYESPACGQLAGGALNQFQTGAVWRAAYQNSDFTLIELNQTPAPEYRLFYAGWDARGLVPQRTLSIHHPSTDEKAISFDFDPSLSIDLLAIGDETHWQVDDWDLGTTEPGSSGSCLFDPNTSRCLGTLTGGFAACGNDEPDWYGKVSRHWNGGGTTTSRLSNWLDPVGSGVRTIAGYEAVADTGDDCVPTVDTLCLQNGRFQVRVDWRDFQGNDGIGSLVPGASDDSGLFWFFSPSNWEMLVKVLDACPVNDRFWVFAAATTDVEYSLEVLDTQTGERVIYDNPLGNAAAAITDTSAFATCDG